jgi:hypothetical protein
MPMTVRLMRAGSELNAETDVGGFIVRSAGGRDGWRLLRYVDEHGDTFFNRRQMADFLADRNDARALAKSVEDHIYWSKVQNLARECEAGAGLYLQLTCG